MSYLWSVRGEDLELVLEQSLAIWANSQLRYRPTLTNRKSLQHHGRVKQKSKFDFTFRTRTRWRSSMLLLQRRAEELDQRWPRLVRARQVVRGPMSVPQAQARGRFPHLGPEWVGVFRKVSSRKICRRNSKEVIRYIYIYTLVYLHTVRATKSYTNEEFNVAQRRRLTNVAAFDLWIVFIYSTDPSRYFRASESADQKAFSVRKRH